MPKLENTIKTVRSSVRLACVLAVGAFVSGAAYAQAWPVKPVRWVVPFAAGGPADVIARVVGPKLSERLGQPVIIDNRAGGNSNIGHEAVARSAPAGYTLLYAKSGVRVDLSKSRL